jgi:hypothetical protein
LNVEVSEEEKTGRIGMSCHVLTLVFACQDVQRSVFNGVVTPGFKNER